VIWGLSLEARLTDVIRSILDSVGAEIELKTVEGVTYSCRRFYEGAFCEVSVKYKNKEGEARTLTTLIIIRDNPPE